MTTRYRAKSGEVQESVRRKLYQMHPRGVALAEIVDRLSPWYLVPKKA